MTGEPKKSFAEKVASSRGDLLWRVDGKNYKGEETWLYILVEPAKLIFFQKAITQPRLIPSDFGAVVRSGVGKPGVDDRLFLKDNYNTDVA